MTYTLEQIKEMMDGDGSLDLRNASNITLPEGLTTIGGYLYLRNASNITGLKDHYRKLTDGEYVAGRYLYADGVFTLVSRRRKIGEYIFYQGKIKGKNVVSDGKLFAHCSTFKDGVCDIAFKKAKDRGVGQYRGFTLDTVVTVDEAKTMYRIITGACRAGTQGFVNNVKNIKRKYTVAEIIELTRGHYGAEIFERFFKEA